MYDPFRSTAEDADEPSSEVTDVPAVSELVSESVVVSLVVPELQDAKVNIAIPIVIGRNNFFMILNFM
jgi:phosphoglycerate dehydrogenase-like enzyme